MSDFCVPCNIAAALGITRNICEEYKGELDCRKLQHIIDHPDVYSTDDAAEAITKLAEKAQGKAKELMDCVVTMMRGEKCQIPERFRERD